MHPVREGRPWGAGTYSKAALCASYCCRDGACLWYWYTGASGSKQPVNISIFCSPAPLPDLYIPLMSLWTYCLLLGVAALARSGPTGGFKPETIYNSVRGGCSRCDGLPAAVAATPAQQGQSSCLIHLPVTG